VKKREKVMVGKGERRMRTGRKSFFGPGDLSSDEAKRGGEGGIKRGVK